MITAVTALRQLAVTPRSGCLLCVLIVGSWVSNVSCRWLVLLHMHLSSVRCFYRVCSDLGVYLCACSSCRIALQATTRGGATEFATALQASMAAVVCIACVAIGLQQHITNKAEEAAAAIRQRHAHRHNSMHSSNVASVADLSRAASPAAAAAAGPQQQQEQEPQEEKKPQASLRESFKVLASSVEIRCLATMSLAQGLCNSLMEFAWKCHMRLLYPSPADFTAFLGQWHTMP